ncbi:LANO_0H09098g1_1 [Lachancea nothofagi CBS 11611]|uniref:LANO_0H09098g1_1 n=1 Tax=Lachancea nothofagi CBS 11611 TaxID=1266666 RepID=A0A1G4KM14_9SACH|nr:LANO_0H09098g1_1 [Lachancea nothofagi CBS 11611]
MSGTFQTQVMLSRPYLTRSQIKRAQQNTIPDRRVYNQKRLSAFKLLCDMCVQLKFPRKTLETAMYFYQRYYLFNKFETELCYDVATSCLFLSCKQVETIKKIADIVVASLRLRNVLKVSPEMQDNCKKRIVQLELRILETCSFDYRVNNSIHIDGILVKIAKDLSLSREVTHLAWIIAFDALKLEILLMVPQHTIALAVLKISCELIEGASWPNIRYSLFESDEPSVSEAYFDILNFFINVFDLSDLRGNLTENLQNIGIETFIELKKHAGLEKGLKEPDNISSDALLTNERDFTIRERRYVLSRKRINDERSNKHIQKKEKT